MSDFIDIIKLIVARFDTNYTATAKFYDNIDFDQISNTPFVLFSVHLPGANLISVGDPDNRLLRYTGTIEADVYVPANSGIGDALTYAGNVASIFRLQSFGGVQCYEPRLGTARNSVRGGNWYMQPVFIPFDYDTTY